MSDLLSAPRGELLKLIYDLVEENQALKAQVAELQKRLGKENPPSRTTVPPFVKPNVKRKKKAKRKKRALNFARRNQKPDKHTFHSYKTCPNCQGSLGKPSVAFTRQVIDIPLPKAEITEHVFFKRWCISCKVRVYPGVNLRETVVGKQRFGINLTSLVSTLNEEYLLTLNKIRSFLKMTYDLEISEGGVVRLLETTGKKGKSKYQLRDIKNLQKEIGSRHPPLNKWASKVRDIYKEAKNWTGPDPNLPLGLKVQESM